MTQPRLVFGRHNAVFLAICLAGLLLLVMISIVPLRSRYEVLNREVDALKQKLTAQRQNQAAIALVDSVVAKLDQQPGPRLVALKPLPQDQTSRIEADARDIAKSSSLELVSVEPQLDDKGASSWRRLTVRAELKGQLPALRDFLLGVLSLPYVRQVTGLEVHADDGGLRFKLTYTIDLA
ncbi:MAG: hypothetical protein M0Z90_07830 [Desulfobacteraceae bacterium]|nr:hypothetical protein [Desulfobacteraceae bacterium]